MQWPFPPWSKGLYPQMQRNLEPSPTLLTLCAVMEQTGTEGATERETPAPKKRKGPGRPPRVPPAGCSSQGPRSNTPELDAASVAGQSEPGDAAPDPEPASKDNDEDKEKAKEVGTGKAGKQTEPPGKDKERDKGDEGPEAKGDAVDEGEVDDADKEDDNGARSKLRPRLNQCAGGKPPPRKVPRRTTKGGK